MDAIICTRRGSIQDLSQRVVPSGAPPY